jgi:hypothetical protein
VNFSPVLESVLLFRFARVSRNWMIYSTDGIASRTSRPVRSYRSFPTRWASCATSASLATLLARVAGDQQHRP